MHEVATALFTGVLVGSVFTLLRLPIPAPPTIAGIAGIIGIFVGYLLITLLGR